MKKTKNQEAAIVIVVAGVVTGVAEVMIAVVGVVNAEAETDVAEAETDVAEVEIAEIEGVGVEREDVAKNDLVQEIVSIDHLKNTPPEVKHHADHLKKKQ